MKIRKKCESGLGEEMRRIESYGEKFSGTLWLSTARGFRGRERERERERERGEELMKYLLLEAV